MSLLRLLVLLLLMMPFLSYAEDEEQKPGSFSVAVSASGFFRPKLTEVEVIEVSKNSPAEKAGMVAGQKIRSINGCQIPGCPVTEMEKLMGKNLAQPLSLLVETEEGKQTLIQIPLQ